MTATLSKEPININDFPLCGRLRRATRPQTQREEYDLWNKALSVPFPAYRAKVVNLPHGQTEVSITPIDTTSVINARMGFNPLLDCPRKLNRTEDEQAARHEENRQRAAKRARQQVRYLVKSTACNHMLTFSYRDNVTSREVVQSNWQEFVRLFRIRYPKWSYLAVLEQQERGSFHIHVAVQGKQDIRWLLRCWLLAIGQDKEDVSNWLINGLKLADKSLGAVNVQAPTKRWGGGGNQWKRDKLSGYLTKYIGKEFEAADKNRKKYWHSKNIEKPQIERFWLKATSYLEAVREAHDLVYYTGADNLSMWGSQASGVIWITGETDRDKLKQFSKAAPEDYDFLEE